jgi:RNA polymerase sigma factor (sigma-70 family)
MSGRETLRRGEVIQRMPGTLWTLVRGIRTKDQDRRRRARRAIAARYWIPLRDYLLAAGEEHDAAMDLVQGFLLEVLQGRLDQYGPGEARFRHYLVGSLKTYVLDVKRRGRTRRRAPKEGKVVSLEGADGAPLQIPSADPSPFEIFEWKWAWLQLHDALERVETALRSCHRSRDWEVFSTRVGKPLLYGAPPTPVQELAHRYGIAAGNVTRIVKTVSAREFRRALRETVNDYVPEEQIEDEIRDLLRLLPRGIEAMRLISFSGTRDSESD